MAMYVCFYLCVGVVASFVVVVPKGVNELIK